jgi:hypothetical protein
MFGYILKLSVSCWPMVVGWVDHSAAIVGTMMSEHTSSSSCGSGNVTPSGNQFSANISAATQSIEVRDVN